MLWPMAQIERRVNGLAVAWLVYAGLAGLIGLAFAHAFLQGHGGGFSHWYGPGYGPGYGRRFWHGPEWPMFALRFARITLAVKVGLALAAGIGLMQKAHWGRIVALVAGCLALLSFPFGTAIGIWTLVVLLNASNTAAYELMTQG